jgi:hypothetical protein
MSSSLSVTKRIRGNIRAYWEVCCLFVVLGAKSERAQDRSWLLLDRSALDSIGLRLCSRA